MEQLLTDPWFWVPIAFWVGWKISELWQMVTFKELLSDLGVKQQDLEKIKDQLEQADTDPEDENSHLPILEVRIEQHPEGLFAYRKVDDSFIAQGKDREGLMENLVNNLNNVRVIVHKEDGGDLISS
jgi:hypothetical protein